jgi:hypothetical protein
MSKYRLSVDDVYGAVARWDNFVSEKILLVACGGTALTLQGYKDSTKDVDFIVPRTVEYKHLVKCLSKEGYAQVTGYGWKHPDEIYIFDLFVGGRVFVTDLLEIPDSEGLHKVVRTYERITLAVLNSLDLIVSKMMRGDAVDVQDSILLIKAEALDLDELLSRFKETAGFYNHPEQAKKNFGYLIAEMERLNIDVGKLKKGMEQWTL